MWHIEARNPDYYWAPISLKVEGEQIFLTIEDANTIISELKTAISDIKRHQRLNKKK